MKKIWKMTVKHNNFLSKLRLAGTHVLKAHLNVVGEQAHNLIDGTGTGWGQDAVVDRELDIFFRKSVHKPEKYWKGRSCR